MPVRKEEEKRLKGFKFRTFMGRFYDDIMAAKASFSHFSPFNRCFNVDNFPQFLNVLCVIVIFF